MARACLIRTDLFAYHVTARSNNREWFYLPLRDSWEIFSEMLWKINHIHLAHIHAFVLMGNHYHLALSTPLKNLDEIMRYFQTEVARRFKDRSGRINHVFGGRYRWTLLPDSRALAFAYKYIARNPVRAGLTKKVEDYSFSSFFVNPSYSAWPLPICEGFDSYWGQIPRPFEERLSWLNQPTPKESESLVKAAMNHHSFRFTCRRGTERAIQLLHKVYGVQEQIRDQK